MPTRFVCLANSYKEGGRCLAGIILYNNNDPVIENGLPKWIRPICNTAHGEVYTYLVSHVRILDIIEIEVTGYPEKSFQSENALFNENSIRTIGRFPGKNLSNLCSNKTTIFGNKGKAISIEKIGNLTHSLMLIHIINFDVVEKTYDDSPVRTKIRLVFSYNSNQYDLPVTDPVFIHHYQNNPDFIDDVNELFLCLSIGVNWKDWYYKLVAGVIYRHNPTIQPNLTEPIDDLPF